MPDRRVAWVKLLDLTVGHQQQLAPGWSDVEAQSGGRVSVRHDAPLCTARLSPASRRRQSMVPELELGNEGVV